MKDGETQATCTRDNTTFTVFIGSDSMGEYIQCPTCARRFREWKPGMEPPVNFSEATEPGWYSDRKLRIES